MLLNESNYHSKESNEKWMSSTQWREWVGTLGMPGCEARALARVRGEWKDEESIAFLIGNFCDAHFSGTLDTFKAQNPDIFTKQGELKAQFKHAEVMIARYEQDEYFMRTLAGGTQVIKTDEFAGLNWRIKIDNYHEGKAIVDFKTTKSIKDKHYVKDYGHMNFAEYFGYYAQLAIYQKIDEIDTGKRLPCFIAAVSKEKVPDIGVFLLEQKRLDEEIQQIELKAQRVIDVKYNGAEAERCENCDYCTSTKKLTTYIFMSEV